MSDDDDDGVEGEEITQKDLEDMVDAHEKEMMAILSVSTEITNDDIAEEYGVSEKTVRRAKKSNKEKLREIGLITD